jgi:hypothetical protein
MSMRARLRRHQPPSRGRAAAFDATAELRAAALLEKQRGKAPRRAAASAGRIAAALLKPLLPERTMGLKELQRRWSEIAGEQIARAARPDRLAAGVLTLKTPSAFAPFLQHQQDLIIERCRTAGASIKSIRIEQGRAGVPPRDLPRNVRVLTPAEEEAIAASVENVADDALKAALLRLGRAVSRG